MVHRGLWWNRGKPIEKMTMGFETYTRQFMLDNGSAVIEDVKIRSHDKEYRREYGEFSGWVFFKPWLDDIQSDGVEETLTDFMGQLTELMKSVELDIRFSSEFPSRYHADDRYPENARFDGRRAIHFRLFRQKGSKAEFDRDEDEGFGSYLAWSMIGIVVLVVVSCAAI